MTHKRQVQTQFGTRQAIEGYASSDIHAKGESLALLATLIDPRPTWQALDVGSGAGHTAHLFAGRAARVVAADITPAMAATTTRLAAGRGLTGVKAAVADAESLPFADHSFDLLTCRLAFHHFPNPRAALAGFARLLKPEGTLGFTDNFTVLNRQAAGYYNAFEKLRDPSHHWVYPLPRLQAMLQQAGFTLDASHNLSKELEFNAWADRQNVSAANKEKLLDMMRHIPEALVPFFAPRWAGGTLYFTLHEVVVVATRRK